MLEAPLVAGELGLFGFQLVFALAKLVLLAGEHLPFAVDVFPELVAGFEGFGGRSEEAVVGVLLDDFEGLLREGLGVRWEDGVRRQVGAGDLEAVEEEPGAAGVEVVGGDALENEADGELDGGTVLGDGEVEGGEAGFAGGGVGYGVAGGVVVVAEVLVAEGGGAAAASVDEDVAAAVAVWLFDDDLVWHGVPLGFGVNAQSKVVRSVLRWCHKSTLIFIFGLDRARISVGA